MDERKWAKVPTIPADAFMVDLEDSVPPGAKDAARVKAAACLGDSDFFQHKLVLARPNNLSTPWGRDDLAALGEAGVACLAYPKASGIDELDEVLDIVRSHGADPTVFAIIETASGVLNVDSIAAHPQVRGLMFGPGDLSLDSGIELFGHGHDLNQALTYPAVRTVLSGAAANIMTATIAYLANIKDLDEAGTRYGLAQRMGFTTGITFYPPHVPVVNGVFGPTEDQVRAALEVIARYEEGLAAGEAAVALDDGRVILVHDYEKAVRLRDRGPASHDDL